MSPASQQALDQSKVFSFVSLPGVNQKKRPRRKYHEVERLYQCNFPDCTKAYGTLNHLNAHVCMQGHGLKRHPNEFKELRKQWRRQKRENQALAKREHSHDMDTMNGVLPHPSQMALPGLYSPWKDTSVGMMQTKSHARPHVLQHQHSMTADYHTGLHLHGSPY
ncbi:hypothetical protein J3Q64DRAFT_1646438 [Phycomyces blakesleeanus]|uniref:C2H2-type domain-containing protein n=2 Tax=Phycomyces blakesleeanus TaxID=4837 RepID=A0ABR3AMM7_PHYBL